MDSLQLRIVLTGIQKAQDELGSIMDMLEGIGVSSLETSNDGLSTLGSSLGIVSHETEGFGVSIARTFDGLNRFSEYLGALKSSADNSNKSFQGLAGGVSGFRATMSGLIVPSRIAEEAQQSLAAGATEAGLKIKNVLGMLNAGVAVVSAFADVSKAAFNLASEGAQITDLSENFSRLAGGLGQSKVLLDELRDSANGTISDVELLSVVSKVLASSQGQLRSSLSESSVQLLEMAATIHGLYPILGDTSSIYLALNQGVLGLNTQQLANLGIAVDSQKAYLEYANSIGVSTATLSDQDRQLALLNQTLKLGNELIKQSGGASTTAASNYERLGAAWDNNANRIKRDFAVLFDPLVSHLADSQEQANAVSEAMDLLGVSYNASTSHATGFLKQYELLNGEFIDGSELLERAAQKQHEMAFAEQEAAEMAKAYALSQQSAATATDNLVAATIAWQDVDANLSSSMERDLVLMRLQAAGLGDLQQAWDEMVAAAAEDGEITKEEIEELDGAYEDLGLSAEAMRLSVGDISSESFLAFAEGVLGSGAEAVLMLDLVTNSGASLDFVLTSIAEGKSAEEIAKAIEEMHKTTSPKLSDMADEAGALQRFLLGIPKNVSSNVSVDISVSGDVQEAVALGISVGQWRAIRPELQATGGPLSDLSLVGEEGPELIINGVVIPAQETRKLMALGLLPKRRFAIGGPLNGGGSVVAPPPEPPDFDPLNLDQRAQLRASRSRSAASTQGSNSSSASRSNSVNRERQSAQDLSRAIQEAVSSSVAAVVPEAAIAASQAAAAVAPSTLTSASQQISRQVGRDIQISNERLMGRVDQLILETRRMKTYFRDAVRLISD